MNNNITPPRVYVNSTTTGSYKPPVWQPVRPRADDHLKFKSLGVLTGKGAV